MKKWITLFLILALTIAMCLSLTACSTEEFELALITDVGTIDDGSFNQGSWEGLKQYADENNISHKYYQPAAKSDDDYLETIELAVKGGAKLIVTPGFLFSKSVFLAQDQFPDIKFVFVDGLPNNGDWDNLVEKVGSNTVSLFYAEEQSGFLAGYAAVKDGYRELGFMGGMAVPAVVRFGHGYVQGAKLAAEELRLEDGAIRINYYYTGDFVADPAITTRAAAWYNDGIEVIFACGGAISDSIWAAAQDADKKTIGVDVDQSHLSNTVITSAMKGLTASVYDAVKMYYDGNFPGGQELIFDAANAGVGLPMANSRFNTFTQADYNDIFSRLVSGAVTVDGDTVKQVMDFDGGVIFINDQGGRGQ